MTRLARSGSRYSGRRRVSASVRPYLIAHERAKAAKDFAFRQFAGLVALSVLGDLR
ncbi:hypothetical protein F4561_005142 [Lipingzhangella halophila]|uniref:Uncharacterized protein n=1 Tax=Lipingzhangella halophila TaxID=1783352 RepID=A0A7W7RLR5_9ACTN|nr:hypothetical protein [Lipingzhangella halophila]